MIMPKTVRDKVVEQRAQRQLKQGTLAKMAGVSQSTVCLMEKGITGVSEENTWKILAALDLKEEGWKALHSTHPWGEWLTPGQAAELLGTTAPKIMSLAYHQQIAGARLSPEGNWWIPAYHPRDPRRTVAIDFVHGTGNQYVTPSLKEKQDAETGHYTKEFFLHQGIVVLHIEKGDTQQYQWTIEANEGGEWRKIQEETLPKGVDSSIHILRVSEDDKADTRPGPHRVQIACQDTSRLTWTQPAPQSGWSQLTNTTQDPEEEQPMAEAGPWLFGPTLPTGHNVTAHIRTTEEAEIQVEAFATDGAHIKTIYDGTPSHRTVTVDTELDPEKEYVMTISAKSDWHIDWVKQTT